MNQFQKQNPPHNSPTPNQPGTANFQQPNFNTQNQNTMNQFPPNQFNQQNQNQPINQEPSMLMQIVGSCLPVILKQFTGQEMPSGGNSSNSMEMSLVLSQVLTLQQQIITSQQALNQRLANLENNASQQFTNLVQQVKGLKSVRLIHDRERREINLSPENASHH